MSPWSPHPPTPVLKLRVLGFRAVLKTGLATKVGTKMKLRELLSQMLFEGRRNSNIQGLRLKGLRLGVFRDSQLSHT